MLLYPMSYCCHDDRSSGVRVVTNAGGINPHGCVDMVKKVAKSQGVDVSVAMVTGDDMLPMVYMLMKS